MKTIAEAHAALSSVLANNTLKPKNADIVGSVYALGVGKDIDILVFVADKHEAARVLDEQGWRYESIQGYAGSPFVSLRANDINLLVTDDEGFYNRTLHAADVCKLLKVATREDRVKIHRIVRDGISLEDL